MSRKSKIMKYLAHPRWTKKGNINEQQEVSWTFLIAAHLFIDLIETISSNLLLKSINIILQNILYSTHMFCIQPKRHHDECVWVTGRGAVFSVLYLWDEKYRKYFFENIMHDHIWRLIMWESNGLWKSFLVFYSHRAIINTPPPYCCDEISYDHANIVFTSFTVCLFMYIHNSYIYKYMRFSSLLLFIYFRLGKIAQHSL